MKESENVYSLWCSGRLCVEGMLVTLKLLKRQDLVSSISRMFKPAADQIVSDEMFSMSMNLNKFLCCLCSLYTYEGNKYGASLNFQLWGVCHFPPSNIRFIDRLCLLKINIQLNVSTASYNLCYRYVVFYMEKMVKFIEFHYINL